MMNTALEALKQEKITIETLPAIREAFSHYKGRRCDLSAGVALFWRDHYHISFVRVGDCISLCYSGKRLTLPQGKHADDALRLLLASGRPLTLAGLGEEDVKKVLALCPEATVKSHGRDYCDYLYDAEDLKTLAGRRFSGQRNHINKFKKLYPDARFEPITADNLSAALDFCRDYFENYGKKTDVSDYEYAALRYQLENWEAYGQLGGLLLDGDRAIALSTGEVVGDTLIVHTEKADIRYAGVYPMMVKSFACAFATDGVRYINREEDLGDEGLRTSKLSYHPVALLEKFTVTLS